MVEYLVNDPDSKIFFVRNWLSKEESLAFYAAFLHELKIKDVGEAGTYIVNYYGRPYTIPRKIFIYGESGIKHTFRGKKFAIYPWSDIFGPIRERINEEMGIMFNSCTVNWYPDGNYFIKDHHDTGIISPGNAVLTVSLGASRTYVVKGDSSFRTSINTGDVFCMTGRGNELWTHGIPKEKVKPLNGDPGRISLTFRDI